MGVERFDEAAVLFAFGCSVVFLAGYSLVSRWWRRPLGRALAALDVGLGLALAPTAMHYLVGLNVQHPFFAWYYGFSLISVGLITLWRLVVVVAVQRAATPRRRAPGPSTEADERIGGPL